MPVSRRGLEYDVTTLVPPWRKPGRPVVFHHGIGAVRAVWSLWLPIIAPHHPAWCFDTRGFGNSPALPEPAGSLLDLLIDDVLDVAGTTDPVHLVGESAGGTVVLAAALRYPERVATVTISNAAFVGSGIAQIGGWSAQFAQGGTQRWSEGMMENRFAPGALDRDAEAWFSREQERTKPASALAVAAMLASTDLSAEVASLRVPLLILSPDSSPYVPVTMAAELKARVPHAELRTFPGARHGLPFSHAEESAGVLRDFLTRHGG